MLSSDPSPLFQTAVYMGGILTGYALLTPPEEWSRAWRSIRTALSRRRER